jgi:hypothetical protein
MWKEIIEVASIEFSDEEDELIWQFQSFGLYSSHSLYMVINFKGLLLCTLPLSRGSSSIPPPPKSMILPICFIQRRNHVTISFLLCRSQESLGSYS